MAFRKGPFKKGQAMRSLKDPAAALLMRPIRPSADTDDIVAKAPAAAWRQSGDDLLVVDEGRRPCHYPARAGLGNLHVANIL